MTITNPITPFLFGETLIRIVNQDGSPWFVGKDVCECLGLNNHRMAIQGSSKSGNLGLDDDEKGVMNHDTLGGEQGLLCINESGLYTLIFKSRKPEARAFRKWVTSVVLPAIRKRGFYSHRTDQLLSFVRELMELGFTAKDASILARSEFPPLTKREREMQAVEAKTQEALEELADPEGDLLLSLLLPGVDYRTADLFALLPAGHRILAFKTPRGRATAIGQVMERLNRLGKVARVNAQYSTFRLADPNKIVSMRP